MADTDGTPMRLPMLAFRPSGSANPQARIIDRWPTYTGVPTENTFLGRRVFRKNTANTLTWAEKLGGETGNAGRAGDPKLRPLRIIVACL